MFPSRESRLRRELTELKEQSEPVLHVPGRGQALAVERVELVQAETDLLARRSDTEEFALMRTADFSADGNLAG